MQLKGLVTTFAVLLIIISLYQLHFTWVVNSHENKLEAKANSWVNAQYAQASQEEKDAAYKNRLRRLKDSTKTQTVTYDITGAVSYQKAKERELNLGLDLQGGMSVTLDIELEGMLRSLSNNSKDPAFNQALRLATDRKKTSDADYITLFAQAYKEVNPSGRLAAVFASASQSDIKTNDSDNEVLTKVRSIANGAIKNTYDVLTKRIDQFGVAQPNINFDQNKGIITVELPGVQDNPERIRKILQSTANLQFYEVYNINELGGSLQSADVALREYLSGTKPAAATPDTTNAQPSANNEDSSASAQLSKALTGTAADTSKKASTPTVNSLTQLVQFISPVDQNGDGRPEFASALGYVQEKDTAVVGEYLRMDLVRNNFPNNVRFVYGIAEASAANSQTRDILPLYALKTVEGSDKAKLEGDGVQEARLDYDDMGRPAVTMRMTRTGEKTWGQMTTDNVGRSIAIVLDNIVYSAPNVQNPILNGNSIISGSFTVQEAEDLANILRSGRLPAPARIVHEQVVGPTLGQAAINGGALAFGISFAVIFILMLVYYNTSGWVANIALILNLIFTVGVLSALGATLTAPGIAGLVLTIGMAVDTNVIIFERIKDELNAGKGYQQAVSEGYKLSLAPVLDAHVTTLITAIILFYFGLGPILGFATTQILGIILSLFCGILISRLVSEFWTRKGRHFEYFTKLSRSIFKHANFKFIEFRKVAYVISVFVVLGGIGALLYGFDQGVEYKGGRSYTVRFDQPMNIDEVRNTLQQTFNETPVIKTVGDNRTLNITTSYQIENSSPSADSLVENTLFNGLKPYFASGATFADYQKNNKQSSYTVQPSISDDLKKGAVKATIFSLIAIFLYIFIRFRDWRYSMGTIFALLHDVFVILIVFSFLKGVMPFPLEIDQHFIAAVLTVIGFSMNDTVIVFDRVREFSRKMKGASKTTIINRAINDTLSRTIMTSLTVFLTLLILFIFGGEVTRGFAFAMLIGVITGTYSTIFVAAPILVDIAKDKPLGESREESEETSEVKKGKVATA